MTLQCGRLSTRLVCALVHRSRLWRSHMVLAPFHAASSTHTHHGLAWNSSHAVFGFLDMD